MRIVLSLISLAFLAACGADGEPQATAKTGVAVSGTGYFGTSAKL